MNNSKRVKIYPKFIKCRTCLGLSEINSSVNISTEYVLGKTIKEILLLFMPQMVKSPMVDDFICSKCAKQVLDFTDFIGDCIKLEHFLVEESIKTQQQIVKDKGKGKGSGSQTNSISINVPSENGVDPIQTIQLKPVSKNREPTSNENLSGIKRNDTVPNRPCKTCGDIYTPDIWTAVECSKCTFSEKNIDINVSDVASISGNSNNESDDGIIIEKNPIILVKEAESPDALNNVKADIHDTVLTVVQEPREIENFVHEFSDTIKIIDYPPNNTNNKRVLFLGNSLTQCVTCKELLQKPKELKLHFIKAHSNLCIPELDSDDDYEDARRGKRTFDCPFCDIKVGTALLLVEHLRENHTIKNPFKCEKCGKEFKKRDQHTEHLKRFEKSFNCDLKKCRYCPEMLSDLEYQSHISSHKHIFCDQCGKSFLNQQRFKAHYDTHRNDGKSKKVPKTEPVALCPICGKLLSKRHSLDHHIAIHGQRPRNYICHKCPKTFLTAFSLKTHLTTAHGDKKYTCPLCNIKVKTQVALMNHHNLKHSQNYSHICKICGNGFSRGDYFRRHMACHNKRLSSNGLPNRRPKYNYSVNIESKTAKCKFCFKGFKSVNSLKKHLMCHVITKRYKCKFCNMTFVTSSAKSKHEKRHADPKFDLRCTVCSKQMESREELELHLAKHHKKYECEECESLFVTKNLLNDHMVTEHIPEEEVEKEEDAILMTGLEEFLL